MSDNKRFFPKSLGNVEFSAVDGFLNSAKFIVFIKLPWLLNTGCDLLVVGVVAPDIIDWFKLSKPTIELLVDELKLWKYPVLSTMPLVSSIPTILKMFSIIATRKEFSSVSSISSVKFILLLSPSSNEVVEEFGRTFFWNSLREIGTDESKSPGWLLFTLESKDTYLDVVLCNWFLWWCLSFFGKFSASASSFLFNLSNKPSTKYLGRLVAFSSFNLISSFKISLVKPR